MSEWYEEELAGVDLGDRRLNRRAVGVLGNSGKQPSQSIPGRCRSWAETLAAYRLFNHTRVTAERLLAPHFAATVERQGMFTHLSLGLVEARFWTQDPARPHKHATRKRTQINQKQSGWWLRSYQLAGRIAQQGPETKVISVADREGDIDEVFVAWQQAEGPRAGRVVRACQDRSLPEKEPGQQWRYQKL